MKKIFLLFITATLFSCQGFLEEELVATLTYEHYNTEQGMEDLIKSAYAPLRFKTGYEQAYCLWNFGTDEYTHSDQVGWKFYNEYGAELNSSHDWISALWDNNYNAINRCNIAIERIPNVAGQDFLATDQGKAIRSGEVHFLRGYYYFQMVQQYGALVLKTRSSSGVELEFERTPVEDIYKQIISDFRFAVENLPEQQNEYGRATANAARHFLAKAYLTRGSAVTQERGQQPTDMDSAAYYADQCIDSPLTSLMPDYADVWDPANQQNSEIVFATQFTTDPSLISGSGIGYQNTTHLYWLNQYDNEPGMTRSIQYGRPYRRLMPTDYAYDIHDRLNDSRLRKSLLEVFLCNNAGNIPTWTSTEVEFFGGDPSLVGQPKFSVGDTALVFLVNDAQTTLTDRQITAMGYKVYARYYWETDANGDPVALREGFVKGKAPSLWKYIDRERDGFNNSRGTRDNFVARLSETYLIAAEAYGRNGDYVTALERINEVRRRAAYHDGEAKPHAWWKYDGGTPGDLTSTETAMMATEAHFSTTDNALTQREHYPPGVVSKEDRFVHFILNERCRELLGEMVRWEDLVRTETLVERAYEFNEDVANAGTLQAFHSLRPVPQSFLESIHKDGKPLDEEQRGAMQNLGY